MVASRAHRRRPRCIAFKLASILIAIAASACTRASQAPKQPPGVAQLTCDANWDAPFTRTNGWTAGDIAHSLPIPGGRTLWLFGDSFAGPVREGKHVAGETTMVRGAIAWHETPRNGGAPREIEFALAEPWKDAAVAAWARPAAGLWPEGTWYWLMNDGAAVTEADGNERFVLFTTAIGPAGNPEGMWNFRRIGGAILIVENPHDPPPQWRVQQRRNPLVGETARHGEPRRISDNWGLAIVRDGDWLYIFGVRGGEDGHQSLMLARCEERTLHEPDTWYFFDGDGWSGRAADAAAVAQGVPDEFTIQWVDRDGQAMLVLIQSEPFLGRRIFALTAHRPEGPWSQRQEIFEVPDPARDPRLMTYAAKGHAHLSRPGELLVSYVINSSDFGQVVNDASLYRPRFIRVPLEMLPEAPPIR